MAVDSAKVQDWVAAGIITADQAREILATETLQASRRSPSIAEIRQTNAVEILGYIGAALVLIAAVILVSDAWGDMTPAAQIAFSGAGGGILAGVGFVSIRSELQVLTRIGHLSLMLALVPIGIAVGTLMGEFTSPDLATFFSFVVVLGFSIWWYRLTVSALQHIALFVSANGTVVSAGAVFLPDGNWSWVVGLAILTLGGSWLATSASNRFAQRRLGEGLGIASWLVGELIVFFSIESQSELIATLTLAAFVAVAIAMTAFGVTRDRTSLIVGGMLGLWLFLPVLIYQVFGGAVGVPLAFLVGGTVLIGSAIILAKRSERVRST